jgi:hypothetical protein
MLAQIEQSSTVHSLQKKNTTLEKDLSQFSEKLDTLLENGSASTVTQELRSLRDEVIQYRAEQRGRDQILGLSQSGMISTNPLDALDKSIQSIEGMTSSSSADSNSDTNANNTSNTTPVPANGAMLGTVTLLKDKGWSSVDAFETPVSSSKIVGQIVVNVSYPFYSKQNGWYQAALASGKKGWVQAQFVKEE